MSLMRWEREGGMKGEERKELANEEGQEYRDAGLLLPRRPLC